MLPFDRQ